MSWYRQLEAQLQGSDSFVRYVLVGVIAVALFLLLQPSATARLAGALYFVLP